MGRENIEYNGRSDIPKSVLHIGVKDFTCPICKQTNQVRKDTHPTMCKKCGSASGGHANLGRRIAKYIPCATCGGMIRESSHNTYCSAKCRRVKNREKRTCKQCGNEFVIYASVLKTNAAGNFCTRPCYEKWLCQTDRISGRGSRWKNIAKEAKKRMPFCIVCGNRARLEVHHIVPFRLTYDNSPENLAVLCKKDHKVFESITHEVEVTGVSAVQMRMYLRSVLMGALFELMGRAIIVKREEMNATA